MEYICKYRLISDSGHSYKAGAHITPAEYARLSSSDKTYFQQEENIDFSLRDAEIDYEGQDPEYYDN